MYIQHLKDQYSAETQITTALPKIIQNVTSSELKNAFEMHLEETKGQISRIEQIFQSLDGNPGGKKCVGMEGLLKEGDEAMAEDYASPDLLDAALVGGSQKVEHYEIVAYKDLIHMAKLLGDNKAIDLLTKSLHEEEAANQKLSKLGENIITSEATYAGTAG